MSISLLTLTACSEDDASSIENNPDTETRINTPFTTAESTDSAGTMHGVINDWEEGKTGKLVPVDNPEEGGVL